MWSVCSKLIVMTQQQCCNVTINVVNEKGTGQKGVKNSGPGCFNFS